MQILLTSGYLFILRQPVWRGTRRMVESPKGRDARTLLVIITSFMTNKSILRGRIAASGSLVLIPVLIFALLAQHYLVRGLARGAVKG